MIRLRKHICGIWVKRLRNDLRREQKDEKIFKIVLD